MVITLANHDPLCPYHNTHCMTFMSLETTANTSTHLSTTLLSQPSRTDRPTLIKLLISLAFLYMNTLRYLFAIGNNSIKSEHAPTCHLLVYRWRPTSSMLISLMSSALLCSSADTDGMLNTTPFSCYLAPSQIKYAEFHECPHPVFREVL